jgi:recombination protein RecT
MQITNQTLAPKNGGLAKKPFSQVIAMPSYQTMLANAIQDPTRRQRFITTVVSAVNATPALKNCTPDSIITAALQMESLGLPYGMGDAYIIPYGDKATFQIGARGYITLAMRSGAYQDIDTIEIREGEFKGRDKRSGKPMFEFIEDEDVREDLPIIGYLAHFTLLNGFQAQEYFSKYKMLKWANRYSQAFDIELYNRYVVYQETGEGLTDKELRLCSAPWYETFDEMAFKTVLKRLLSKKGILSVELVEAFKKDKSDGTTDGTMEMNFVADEPQQEEPEQTEAEHEAVEEKPQTTKRGRPPKVVANVVPDDTKPQATKPFEAANNPVKEYEGEF